MSIRKIFLVRVPAMKAFAQLDLVVKGLNANNARISYKNTRNKMKTILN